jgi:hypothetical protein
VERRTREPEPDQPHAELRVPAHGEVRAAASERRPGK